jgi:hypothetical protein
MTLHAATAGPGSGLAVRDRPSLGAAADRFARTTLRKRAHTQRTYAGAYRRFAAWLAVYTQEQRPPVGAFTGRARRLP